MPGPPAPVAAVRSAVRSALADLLDPTERPFVLVACSGGPDSLALAAATVFEAKDRFVAGLVTVDHGLQAGSTERSFGVARWAEDAGFAVAEVRTVAVGTAGGPEAAARTARYAALAAAAEEHGATAVLLGHTLDDQAETVLLGLARGSGARSLSGMALVRGRYRRPLLGLRRAVVHAAAEGLPVWTDPHNRDPAYARSRLREAMATLDTTLGPGLTDGLARTARLLRADADALDALTPTWTGPQVEVEAAATLPEALRTRAVRRWLVTAGVPAGALGAVHVEAVDALLCHWRGQGPVALPLGYGVARRHGRLHLTAPTSIGE